jgi:hypothetical protein
MPWMIQKIPARPQSGAYYWVVKTNYELTTTDDTTHKAEVHVTVAHGDMDTKAGTFKSFHVKFDVKSSTALRIFFFFKDSGGKASVDSTKGTSESDAKKKGISGGEYSELKAEAIRTAEKVVAKVKS